MSCSVEFPQASDAVRYEWTRRIESEYRSSAVTQQLVLWLTQLGFPRELLDDGLRIATDELDHAELSAEVCRAAGSTAPPIINRQQLGIERSAADSLEVATLRACVQYFCLGETVAVPLFKELRAECVEPTSKKALDRILQDEVRHRRFGWDLLAYFLEVMPDAAEKVLTFLPALLRQIRRSYSGDPEQLTIGTAERAWGLMPRALYSAILIETAEREYLPRFSELDIDAGPAWAAARRD